METMKNRIDRLIARYWANPYKVRTAAEASERADRITRLQKQREKYESI